MNPESYIEISKLLPAEIAWRYKAVPYKLDEDTLTLIIDRMQNKPSALGELEVITGRHIVLIEDDTVSVEVMLRKLYRDTGKSPEKKIDTINNDDFLVKIIIEAKELKSSDIHIETYAEKCRIRFRIDGKLLERYHLPKEHYSSFVNKVKIKAKLDIAEKRLPQDGRILHMEQGDRLDIRVSVLPTLYGEKIVLRLLSNDASKIELSQLGLDERQLSDFTKVLKKPHGIILISGPTGSGKTTTLYATLKILNKEDNNILTVEDPIEYTLDGINQVQLKESIGLSFSSALRTFLRQDPDIIMLGEIRDGETAQMAIRAALTGHLVLSTIHTNSAWGIVTRLTDMGVPPFLLASTLNMTIAQRLVRKLCPKCKLLCKREDDILSEVLPASADFDCYFSATGCDECYYTGYAGRIALYEVIPIEQELHSAIRHSQPEINDFIKANKIITLKTRAISLLKEGLTSMDEIYPILLNDY